MKRYFIETNGYNMVVFADNFNKGCVIDEKSFDQHLTLEIAKTADYRNFDNCETAEECNANYGNGENLIDFNLDDAQWADCIITEF